MKTNNTLTLIGTLGMLAGAALAQPAPSDNSSQLPPQNRFGGGRPDPEMRRKMLTEKYDANKDGTLDDSELATIGKDVVEGKFGPPPGQGRRGPEGQSGPGFGDGPRGQGSGEFDGERPPGLRGQGQPGFGGRPPSGAGDGGAPGLGQRGGREGGLPPRRSQMMDRDGGPEGGQFGVGPRGPAGPNAEFGRKGMEMRRREFIKKYDANGDGKLDSTEREAIGRDIEEGRLPPPPLAPPQPPGGPGEPRKPE